MRRSWLRLVFPGSALILFSLCMEGKEEPNTLIPLLPQKGEAGQWIPDDKPQYSDTDDLYLLINGGAEIYYEYGFSQAAIQSYINYDEKYINLEIFEMTDPAAAFGAFTFKRGDDGEILYIGDGAFLEGYYLNLWKGPYIITLIGLDTEADMRKSLIYLAESIVQKIEVTGTRPPIVELLPKGRLKKGSIKYIRGNMALFNIYEFDRADIFGIREGVYAVLEGRDIFIFQYSDSSIAKSRFSNVSGALSQNGRFERVTFKNDLLNAVTDEGRTLFLTRHANYIITVIGNSAAEALTTLKLVKSNLNKEQSRKPQVRNEK